MRATLQFFHNHRSRRPRAIADRKRLLCFAHRWKRLCHFRCQRLAKHHPLLDLAMVGHVVVLLKDTIKHNPGSKTTRGTFFLISEGTVPSQDKQTHVENCVEWREILALDCRDSQSSRAGASDQRTHGPQPASQSPVTSHLSTNHLYSAP